MKKDLQLFNENFSYTRVFAYPDELKYRFKSLAVAKHYEKIAQKTIIDNGLRVTAELETWSVGGQLREICICVKPVMEEYKVLAVAK